MNLKHQWNKQLKITLIFYAVSISVVGICGSIPSLRSDMCNPGFDFLSAMVSVIVAIFLLVRNAFFLILKENKDHILSLSIHCLVLAALYIALHFSH